jgi:hypothetical protein
MRDRHGRLGALAALLTLAACTTGSRAPDPTITPPIASSGASATPSALDVMELELEGSLEPGTYRIDPDRDPSTPLTVEYEVAAEGWSQWIGAAKFTEQGQVAVSITTVENLVRNGCHDHSPADPAVGPSVDDLATALADLAPFRVTSSPEGVTVYGYRGKYLELTVPDLPVAGDHFSGCTDGKLQSWMSPNLGTPPGENAFWGYNAEPGHTEGFWILDVDGTRLVIEANWSPTSPPSDLAEMHAILDSIRIEG